MGDAHRMISGVRMMDAPVPTAAAPIGGAVPGPAGMPSAGGMTMVMGGGTTYSGDLTIVVPPLGGGLAAAATGVTTINGGGSGLTIGGDGLGVSNLAPGFTTLDPAGLVNGLGTDTMPAGVVVTPAPLDPAIAGGGGATAAAPAATGSAIVGTGGSAADAQLVNETLALLSSTASGKVIADRLLAVGAHINVLSGAEFAAQGMTDAHAFFDPKNDTLYLRREDLQSNRSLAAIELAHEGVHLLDDVGGVTDAYLNGQLAAINGMTDARAAAEALKQLQFESMMIDETRAFTYSGQVAREMGWQGSASDPTMIAARGTNDDATYAKVWEALIASKYNDERRTAAVRNV